MLTLICSTPCLAKWVQHSMEILSIGVRRSRNALRQLLTPRIGQTLQRKGRTNRCVRVLLCSATLLPMMKHVEPSRATVVLVLNILRRLLHCQRPGQKVSVTPLLSVWAGHHGPSQASRRMRPIVSIRMLFATLWPSLLYKSCGFIVILLSPVRKMRSICMAAARCSISTVH